MRLAPSGNRILAGGFINTTTIGGHSITSAGGSDIYIASFPATGNSAQWVRRVGGAATDTLRDVAVGPSGEIVIVGCTQGVVDFGGGNRTYRGSTDVFVAKYAADGSHVWSYTYGDSYEECANGVTIDAAGNVIMTGEFIWGLGFSVTPQIVLQASVPGAPDPFVAKLNSGGTIQWVLNLPGSGRGYGSSVSTADNGDIFIGGRFHIGLQVGSQTFTTGSGEFADDGFLAKLSPAGQVLWGKHMKGPADDRILSVAWASSSAVVIAGYFQGETRVDGTLIQHQNPSTVNRSIALASFHPNTGALQWTKAIHGHATLTGSNLLWDLRPHSGGDVLVAGGFWNHISFDGHALNTPMGDHHGFIAAYRANGTVAWITQFEQHNLQPHGIGVSAANQLIVGGRLAVSTTTAGPPLELASGGPFFASGALGGGGPAATPTWTPFWTATRTPTWTPVPTSPFTPTRTFTPMWTSSPTQTPTHTNTIPPTATPTRTNTIVLIPTWTATSNVPPPTATPTSTRTHTPASTPTPTWTPTATPTRTFTLPPTSTATARPTSTSPPPPSATAVFTATATPTATPTDTPTSTPTQTAASTATTTHTFVMIPTWTPTSPPASTATRTFTPTFTISFTATPTGTPAWTATATATPTLDAAITSGISGRAFVPFADGADYPPRAAIDGAEIKVVRVDNFAANATASGPNGEYSIAPVNPTQATQVDLSARRRETSFGEVRRAIDTCDVALALSAAVGLEELSPLQRLAADVSGNGTISSLDAIQISQRLGEGEFAQQPFDVAQTCDSDWIFRPRLGAGATGIVYLPQIASQVCHLARIRMFYNGVALPERSFEGVPFGDVDLSWPGANACDGQGSRLARVDSGSDELVSNEGSFLVSGRPQVRGQQIRVPVGIDGLDSVVAAEMTIEFDSERFDLRHVRRLKPLRGAIFQLQRRQAKEGRVSVMFASRKPLPEGAFLAVHLVARDREATAGVTLRGVDLIVSTD